MVHTFSRFWASPGNPWCSVWVCGVWVCAILPIFSFYQLNLCAMLLNLPKAIHACHRHHFPDLFEPKWNCSMGILSPSHIFSLKYISRTQSRRLLCWGQWCWFDGIIHIWITGISSNESKRKMRIEEVCMYWLLSNLLKTGTTTSQILFQFHVVQVKCHNRINATSSIHITQTSSKEIKGWTLGWIDKRRTN